VALALPDKDGMSGPLRLDVLVVPYKPIVALIPAVVEGEPTWSAASVLLIRGDHDAVLIDGLLTPADAASRALDSGDPEEPDDHLHHPRPCGSRRSV
jgi:hypothetical protein